MVTNLVDNEALCSIMTTRDNPCNDMDAVAIQSRDLYALQDYIDAQSGGPGKGWFRIVTDPFQARRVINQGKLAVIEGIEVSRIFGCGENNNVPQCDDAQIDAGLQGGPRARRADLLPDPRVRQCLRRNQDDRRRAGASSSTPATGDETGSFWTIAALPRPGPGRRAGDVPPPGRWRSC